MKKPTPNKQLLKNIIFGTLGTNKDLQVFLFGSRAKGNPRPHSDIDIALLSNKPIALATMSLLREKIEESTIPYHVDIVDLATVSSNFRDKVLKEGEKWTA